MKTVTYYMLQSVLYGFVQGQKIDFLSVLYDLRKHIHMSMIILLGIIHYLGRQIMDSRVNFQVLIFSKGTCTKLKIYKNNSYF